MKAPNYKVPEEGLKGLAENWKSDLLAGFIVFLIALPSCLGVSMASGFPAIAGVITAIIGGMIVTFFHGTFVAVKAPAAGLIVIVLSCVETLGQGNIAQGVKLTSAVIVVSGIIQALLGILRAGSLGDFFPVSSVQGMLAAIGVMIIAKEIHKVFGVVPESREPLSLLAELPSTIHNMNVEIAIIGLIGLILLFLLAEINNKNIKKIPAPLIVLILSILMGMMLKIDTNFLVNIPDGIGQYFLNLPGEIWKGNAGPDFSIILTGDSIYFIIMLTAIGSLETLVITNGVDNLDHYKRKSNADKDLTAVGIGNIICGLLGALPMISELVRSSANIDNGARTKWSVFFQGTFLLLFVTLAPFLIRQIPLAALGAMLVYTGYRLASPKLFIKTLKTGIEQFIVFATALLTTLIIDPVMGVLAGLIVECIYYTFYVSKLKYLFKSNFITEKTGIRSYRIKIEKAAIFSGIISFKNALKKIPQESTIEVDFRGVEIVDHSFLQVTNDYKMEKIKKGGELTLYGLEKFNTYSTHPNSFKFRKKSFRKCKI